jgi:hypothetical protein
LDGTAAGNPAYYEGARDIGVGCSGVYRNIEEIQVELPRKTCEYGDNWPVHTSIDNDTPRSASGMYASGMYVRKRKKNVF